MHSLFEPLEMEARAGTQLAPVVLAVALDQTYDYIVPEGIELEPGCFVLVPFGPQSRIGVVWDKPVGETGQARRSQEAEDHHRAARRAAAAGDHAALCRVDRASTRWRRSA